MELGKTAERRSVLKIIAATASFMGLVAVNAQAESAHAPPDSEKVYAMAATDPVIYTPDVSFPPITLPELPTVTVTIPTEISTTTTVPPPPPEEAAPAAEGEWQPPEGCMAPMGPTEAKSIDEAHYCWDGLIARFAWSQSKAFAVMYCESKGNPYADNPSSSATGLMQILDGPMDPLANMSQAYSMYQDRGWQPWVCA
jgi:hypothetical protein